MPRRSPLPPGGDPKQHPALSGGHVVIVSGESPVFKQGMTHEGHAALGQVLEREGLEYEPIHGKYGDKKQPGYIVHVRDDGEVEKLKGIGKRFGQEAIVHSNAGKHQYIYTAGPQEGLATPPSEGEDWFDEEPENNFSTLYGPGGEPLGHFSYHLDFDHPLIPHGKGQMVEAPEAARQVLKAAIESYRGVLIDLRKREMSKAEKSKSASPERDCPSCEEGNHQRCSGKNCGCCGTKKAEWNPTPNLMPVRDQHTGSHPDGSSLSPNKPSHPFSDPSRATSGGTKKYEVESKGNVRHGATPLHDDISADGHGLGRPNNPNTHNIAAQKSEYDVERIHNVRAASAREAAQMPPQDGRRNYTPTPDGATPSIAEERAAQTRKTENPMKLHDLMKSQAARKAQCECGKPGCQWCGSGSKKGNEQGEHGGSAQQSAAFKAPKRGGPGPETKKTEGAGVANNPAREGSQVNVAGAGQKPEWKAMGTAQKAEFPASGPAHQGIPVPGGGTQPTIGGQIHSGGGRTIGQSIFQRVPLGFESGEQLGSQAAPVVKGETNASKSLKRNGGRIVLGKQEFAISRSNQSDAKKRLVETNPVADTSVPAGKETGWRANGDTPKVYPRPASGGAISGNAPKAGPDQKNAPENSAVTGTVPKSSGKNDLIEKAAEAWHKKNERSEESTKPEPRDAQDDEGLQDPMDIEKAASAMAAPKAPSAPGAGSPKMTASPPKAPPAAAPSAAAPAMGKALMPFSAAHGAEAGAVAQQGFGAVAGAAPKAQPKPPSAYDPSLFQPPAGGVKSGLELGGNASASGVRGGSPFQSMGGVGVTPKPASPAHHKGITGFMGKGELCKACGKAHSIGKCQ
jgi:hypothetical protein